MSHQPPATIKTMLRSVDNLHHTANRHAGRLCLLGLIAVAWYNWRLWQRDRTLLARKARPKPLPRLESWPDLPLVSVLVAAWNEAEHIDRHIESFLALRYPHKELVLCAGGNDGTYTLAQKHAGATVKVLEQEPAEGKQRALARAFHATRGTVIFFTDADCVLDDEAFERTVYPVATGNEQVCTGGSQPLSEQMGDPFVVARAASQLYSTIHAPPYAQGLLGGNCAVERMQLERSQGLVAPAPTGTDYVLAKMLVQSGADIRQIPQSWIGTDYPRTVRAYLRQQRRWLRNVALHGRRFGAWGEIGRSLQTSLAGLVMVALPVAIWLTGTRWLGVGWLLLFAHGLLSRFRYVAVTRSLTSSCVSMVDVAVQPAVLLLDFVAWIQPIPDYFLADRQEIW